MSDPFPRGRYRDTSNQFSVGSTLSQRGVVINRPIMGVLTRDQALNLAAWIVVVADPEDEDFTLLLETITHK